MTTTRKTLYLVRGLPGSGKSTLAKQIAPNANIAADDYFTDNHGSYNFDPAKLKLAHDHCKTVTLEYLKLGTPIVAVHNTFSQQWEADDYLEMASKYEYSVFVIECQSSFGSIHGVPAETIDKMERRWEPICH